jgi:hypothetical protein
MPKYDEGAAGTDGDSGGRQEVVGYHREVSGFGKW